ncbi:MAG: exo-alpha-sialidase [Planctomycetes bacterium]|nr:exo-alpha-sialidase [Planctomycetota bacterium]
MRHLVLVAGIFLCLAGMAQGASSSATLRATLGDELAPGLDHKENQYQCDLRADPKGTLWAITAKRKTAEKETIVFLSRDAGRTWKSKVLPDSSDPDCYYDASGGLHVSMINSAAGKKLGYTRSRDGGITWEERRVIPMEVDHPHMMIDLSPESPRCGTIYVAGRLFSNSGIAIARSDDGGDTWVVKQHSLKKGLNAGFVQNVLTSRDGTLLISIRGKNSVRSENGVYAGSSCALACLRSGDGGETLETVELGLREQPADAGPGGMFPVSMAIGPYGKGERLWFIYPCERQAPEPTGLWLLHSDDLGKTWSKPLALHPTLAKGLGVGQAELVANAEGILAVRFYGVGSYGRLGDPKDTPPPPPYGVYAIASSDGGATFCEPVSLASKPLPYSPWGYQRRILGHDQNFSWVLPDGTFVFPWTDTRDRHPNYAVYARTVRFQKAD